MDIFWNRPLSSKAVDTTAVVCNLIIHHGFFQVIFMVKPQIFEVDLTLVFEMMNSSEFICKMYQLKGGGGICQFRKISVSNLISRQLQIQPELS